MPTPNFARSNNDLYIHVRLVKICLKDKQIKYVYFTKFGCCDKITLLIALIRSILHRRDYNMKKSRIKLNIAALALSASMLCCTSLLGTNEAYAEAFELEDSTESTEISSAAAAESTPPETEAPPATSPEETTEAPVETEETTVEETTAESVPTETTTTEQQVVIIDPPVTTATEPPVTTAATAAPVVTTTPAPVVTTVPEETEPEPVESAETTVAVITTVGETSAAAPVSEVTGGYMDAVEGDPGGDFSTTLIMIVAALVIFVLIFALPPIVRKIRKSIIYKYD